MIKTILLEGPTQVGAETQPLPNVSVDGGGRAVSMGLKCQGKNVSALKCLILKDCDSLQRASKYLL